MKAEATLRPAGKAYVALERRHAAAERRAVTAEARARDAEARARAAEEQADRAEAGLARLDRLAETLAAVVKRLDAVERLGERKPPRPPCEPASKPATVAVPPIDASDLLHGYEEIGRFPRISAKQAEHRGRAGEVPTFKLGRIVCARRSTLIAWMEKQEAARHG